MISPFNKPHSICWDCANACGECSWSDHWKHEPVNGWNAIRNDLKTKEGDTTESYIVIECPEFIRDAYGYGAERKRRTDDEGCMQGLSLRKAEVG